MGTCGTADCGFDSHPGQIFVRINIFVDPVPVCFNVSKYVPIYLLCLPLQGPQVEVKVAVDRVVVLFVVIITKTQ